MLVIDASVLVVALADDGEDGDACRKRLRGQVVAAPEVVDLEVLSVLRRVVATGQLPPRRAQLALDDLLSLPMRRASHGSLARRCWELCDNLTPYDAAYVALAEALDCVLLTADARLTRSSAGTCQIELVGST